MALSRFVVLTIFSIMLYQSYIEAAKEVDAKKRDSSSVSMPIVRRLRGLRLNAHNRQSSVYNLPVTTPNDSRFSWSLKDVSRSYRRSRPERFRDLYINADCNTLDPAKKVSQLLVFQIRKGSSYESIGEVLERCTGIPQEQQELQDSNGKIVPKEMRRLLIHTIIDPHEKLNLVKKQKQDGQKCAASVLVGGLGREEEKENADEV